VRAYEPLRRGGDFARVTRRGRRCAGTYLTCFVADGRRRTRVGITISASIGGAVVRNRLRRRIKAILDRSPLDAPPWRDIVFIARPGAGELPYPALADEVARVFPDSAPAAA
jgi:ribonuclease P protein component